MSSRLTLKERAISNTESTFLPLSRECTVGFELEFSGLSVQSTLDTLQQQLQGQIERVSLAERTITHSELGEFQIELDWSYLKKLAKEQSESGEKAWLQDLQQLAEKVVPLEVVCPPLTLSQCEQLPPLVDALRRAGARGTDESWIAAYGVHVNASVPMNDDGHIEPEVIHHYLQAYGLLQWWLFDALQVDTTRKVSPYIDKYPERYLRLLMAHESVTMPLLISDYLEHNASRNRALDMLPLFAHIDPDRVFEVVGDDKVNSRPTFHYRLPNCHIEQPDWNLTDSWKGWWVIEQLANDERALAYWRDEFLALSRPLIGVAETDWKRRMQAWLTDRGWW